MTPVHGVGALKILAILGMQECKKSPKARNYKPNG
jgi:hypothetical protein